MKRTLSDPVSYLYFLKKFAMPQVIIDEGTFPVMIFCNQTGCTPLSQSATRGKRSFKCL
jgi:hypothetical protein